MFVFISAVMENSSEEQREDVKTEEAELTEEKTHNNLKGEYRTPSRISSILDRKCRSDIGDFMMQRSTE